jgi:hypothetical protein
MAGSENSKDYVVALHSGRVIRKTEYMTICEGSRMVLEQVGIVEKDDIVWLDMKTKNLKRGGGCK